MTRVRYLRCAAHSQAHVRPTHNSCSQHSPSHASTRMPTTLPVRASARPRVTTAPSPTR
ncbi:hypothetical protein B0H10DRAFT_2083649 [Mycena sp. CBHHK59/15]|nr:hypothetical protein B0H10DRAFT_2083649 [Mycena sp. CBHHK59/15]